MATTVGRDPFARGEYRRICVSNTHQKVTCKWCGSTPKRLYAYAWQNDDSPRSWESNKFFCNLNCYKACSS